MQWQGDPEHSERIKLRAWSHLKGQGKLLWGSGRWAENSSKWAVVTPGRGKSLCKGLVSGRVWWTVWQELREYRWARQHVMDLRGQIGGAHFGSRQAMSPSLRFHLAISVESLKCQHREGKERSEHFEKLSPAVGWWMDHHRSKVKAKRPFGR